MTKGSSPDGYYYMQFSTWTFEHVKASLITEYIGIHCLKASQASHVTQS